MKKNESNRNCDRKVYITGLQKDSKGLFIKTENFSHFNCTQPLMPYYATIEEGKRYTEGNNDVLELYIKNYDPFRTIEKVICRYYDRKIETRDSQLKIVLSGDSEQTINVELDIYYPDKHVKGYKFNIWYFPVEEYKSRGMKTSISRIVVENSTISFFKPVNDNSVEEWLVFTPEQQQLLDELATEIGNTHPAAATTNEKVEAVMRLFNGELFKGYSEAAIDDLKPVEILRFARTENITHYWFNYLMTLAFSSIGIPSRLIIKNGLVLGCNFALEGSGYMVEYFDREQSKLVVCSPWLEVVRIVATDGTSVDLFDLYQMMRMNLTGCLKVVVYDPLNDNFLELTEQSKESYEMTKQGFDKPYPVNFKGVFEHIDHFLKHGDMEFKAAGILLPDGQQRI